MSRCEFSTTLFSAGANWVKTLHKYLSLVSFEEIQTATRGKIYWIYLRLMNKFIKSVKNILDKNDINTSDIAVLLSDSRKLLEIGNDKRNFPFINFICNWGAHSSLNHSSEIKNTLLDELSNIWISVGDADEMIKQINSKFFY